MGRIDHELELERRGEAFLRERDPFHLRMSRWYRIGHERRRSRSPWLIPLVVVLIAPQGLLVYLVLDGAKVSPFWAQVPVLLMFPSMILLERRTRRHERAAFAKTTGLLCPRCAHDMGCVPSGEACCTECGARMNPHAVIANWIKRLGGRNGRLPDPPAWLAARWEEAREAD